MTSELPYGSWKSPLNSKLASDSSISIRSIHVDPKTPNTLYWSELLPAESGHTIIYSCDLTKLSANPTRWTPYEDFNVADRVHEYGGGAFIVYDGVVYFSNFDDGKIYKQKEKELPSPITTGKDLRYADADYHPNGYLFSVREDHSDIANRPEPVNTIIAINVETGDENLIISGYDFYSSPRVSHDGSKLSWIQWNHPNMPWDDTELWVGDIEFLESPHKVTIENAKKVGGYVGVNFMEPRWHPNGDILFICDKSGWWNLHSISNFETCVIKNLCNVDQEIGGPCWQFGRKSFSPHPTHLNLIAITYNGVPAISNTDTGSVEKIDIGQYKVVECVFQPITGNELIMLTTNPCKPQALLKYNLVSKELDVIHQLQLPSVLCEDGYLSTPRHITFPTDNGAAEAYGYYYPPTNKDFIAPAGTLPPLIIEIHGGPTAAAGLELDFTKQYFTSRGFAILDVNYRGSTGYGTKYRKALNGKWGILDIEDACSGALHMAKGDSKDQVDADKLLIHGGSAGGYTTLACLTFRNVFKAGASYYGISDFSSLAKDTHKFQSRYLDQVIGPYPQDKAIYDARSPIKHLEQFKTACAFFQGSLDKIVPENQTEMMFRAIKEKKIPCAYLLFPNEGHGFLHSENNQKSLDGELYFYSRVLGFKAADKGIEIEILNLQEDDASEGNMKRQKVE